MHTVVDDRAVADLVFETLVAQQVADGRGNRLGLRGVGELGDGEVKVDVDGHARRLPALADSPAGAPGPSCGYSSASEEDRSPIRRAARRLPCRPPGGGGNRAAIAARRIRAWPGAMCSTRAPVAGAKGCAGPAPAACPTVPDPPSGPWPAPPSARHPPAGPWTVRHRASLASQRVEIVGGQVHDGGRHPEAEIACWVNSHTSSGIHDVAGASPWRQRNQRALRQRGRPATLSRATLESMDPSCRRARSKEACTSTLPRHRPRAVASGSLRGGDPCRTRR
ncbi:hypothetical protein SAMN06272789_7122 [Streptomyces sp. 1331.2]|nr:hypothetical protein SAMN06272789_7122 [Streptomyces sp. 1331.2]